MFLLYLYHLRTHHVHNVSQRLTHRLILLGLLATIQPHSDSFLYLSQSFQLTLRMQHYLTCFCVLIPQVVYLLVLIFMIPIYKYQKCSKSF